MVFSSYWFVLVFLPIAVLGYHALGERSVAKNLWVIAAGVLFYAAGAVQHLLVLVVSLVVNYWIGGRLETAGGRKRTVLVAGIGFNLLLLSYFKYAGFLWRLADPTGGGVGHLAFPLGISFYTIQQIMFLVDRYEGLVARPAFLDYARFVLFFPYVTSGPLVRWKDVRPAAGSRADFIARGLYLFVIGLAKKAIVADTLARWVELGFQDPQALTFGDAWVAALAFAFQLYFDFSGYSDMAIGLGLMLGVELPQNFASPYRATSIIEFWKRWHITLSRFITTYLYAPLVRAQGKPTFGRAMVATFLAMVIAGAWHGPTWGFVLFGALHGAALVLNNLARRWRLKVPDWLGWTATFVFVVAAFVVFRAPSIGEAGHMLRTMFLPPAAALDLPAFAAIGQLDRLQAVVIALLAAGVVFWGANSGQLLQRFRPSTAVVAWTVALASFGLLFLNCIAQKDFIYADF